MSVSPCTLLVLRAAVIALVASSASAQAPRPGQTPAGARPSAAAQARPSAQKIAPPKPYRVIAVTLAEPFGDPTFEAFRKDVLDIASRRDRAALARVVASTFFWLGEKGDKANKRKSGIDNLAEAAELDSADGSGWEALTQVVGDATLEPFPERKGILCSPAGPTLDQKAAEQLFKSTGTQPFEWSYTTRPGLDAHAAPQGDAPLVEKLAGIQLVRVVPDDAPGGSTTFVRVVTPGGKLGFIQAEFVKTFPESQICYVKDARGWKIAGLVGG
jgi:hypothetical protein